MKKIIITTLLFFLAFSSDGSAHTVLTSSLPNDGEELVEDVQEIVLEFNSKIEVTSTVKVFNENDEEIKYDNIQVSDNVMSGVFISPLDNGLYTVEWKIIGVDGHPMEGTYSFQVNKEETPALVVSAVTPSLSTSVENPEGNQVKEIAGEVSGEASKDVLTIILVVIAIVGILYGWYMGRRKVKV